MPATSASSTPPAADTRWLHNPLAQRDATLRWRDAESFNTGTFEHVAVNTAGHLVLDTPPGDYPRLGAWTSPEIAADFPLTQVLPSLNLEAPDNTGVRLLVRVRNAGDPRWSPWLDLDGWGDNRLTGAGSVTEFDRGSVEIDYVKLRDAADALQVRVELVAFNAEPQVGPAVRKVVAVYSGPIPDPDAEPAATERAGGEVASSATATAAAEGENVKQLPGKTPEEVLDALPGQLPGGLPGGRVDFNVPFLRQGDNGPSMAPRTCSPTSVTMLLRYHGVEADPVAVSNAIYDRRYGLFGNWLRAVAYASTQRTPDGRLLDTELRRFRTWAQVCETLRAGTPVIASIRFKAGEFPSNRMKKTAGHLIVIRGVTEQGDAIVNDPAYDGRGVVYKAEELAHAWIGKGGVGYVITR